MKAASGKIRDSARLDYCPYFFVIFSMFGYIDIRTQMITDSM
jgi:hypothetical protein